MEIENLTRMLTISDFHLNIRIYQFLTKTTNQINPASDVCYKS